jgi:DNA modification methylase
MGHMAQRKRAASAEAVATVPGRHMGAQGPVEHEFAWVKIDLVRVWVDNPRKNAKAVAKVAASIQRFGWVRPLIVNTHPDCMMELIVGHTALLAAKSLGLVEVPVRFVHLAPEEAHAAALADNKLNEISEWDNALLGRIVAAELIGRPLLEIAGFRPAEIVRLGQPLTAPDDDVPVRPKRPITKTGDVWLLGDHRLVCGDSRDLKVVELCLAGAKPRILDTDPPYGVSFDPLWRKQVAEKTGICAPPKRRGAVQNDDQASWGSVWQHASSCHVGYVWHGALKASVVEADLIAAGFKIRSQLIWAKPQINFTRATYHWQHEPCFYVVRKGKASGWIGDRKQSTLWQIESKHGKSNPDDDDTDHSTQKPVECMARPLRHHSGNVLDPFVGSGTTIIAGTQLERIVYAIDLDPAWVDVAVERWQRLTGGQARRTSSAAVAPSSRRRKAA